MSPRFPHVLKRVMMVHAGIVLVLLVSSSWHRFVRRKKPVILPVEFRVAIPAQAAEAPPEILPAPKPKPAPAPAPVHRPDPRPAPKPPDPAPKPTPKPIQRSTRQVTRTVDPVKPQRTLTDEEIRKLLERGAKVGEDTVIPGQDAIFLDRIRRAFHEAWEQPSRDQAGEATVRASVSFANDGAVVARNLMGQSGNAAMDDSVWRALRAVSRIDGLTADFVRRHRTVTIAFKVE